MRVARLLASLAMGAAAAIMGGTLVSCLSTPAVRATKIGPERVQVPTWSDDDMEFFLHGSMGAEVVPETVYRALIKTYPDMFPTENLTHLGAIPDPEFGWPVGFSRAKPGHLAGLSSVGINCASCHVGEVESAAGHGRVRVLGGASHFNVEGFYNSLLGAGFRTQDPANMRKFLAVYLDECDSEANPATRAKRQDAFFRAWDRQAGHIAGAMAADPSGAKGSGPGGLQKISADDLHLDRNFLPTGGNMAELSVAMLKLFHNERAALHVPDQIPDKLPPASGPGRNDAFGLLSLELLGVPQPYAPVKFGLVWNVENRPWVHWDANTRSPIARNLLATLGLGAPMIGKTGQLDFALLQRQTAITEHIAAPRYPFAIDHAAVARGEALFQADCASCHTGKETDARLYELSAVGTDPLRAQLLNQAQVDGLNGFIAGLQIQGFTPPKAPGVRSTQKYFAPTLAGVWARSPYLHNGTVRTMEELLLPPPVRAVKFRRGTDKFDEQAMGYIDEGGYVLDTRTPANSNAGHDYGTRLTPEQRRDLIEYLKTL